MEHHGVSWNIMELRIECGLMKIDPGDLFLSLSLFLFSFFSLFFSFLFFLILSRLFLSFSGNSLVMVLGKEYDEKSAALCWKISINMMRFQQMQDVIQDLFHEKIHIITNLQSLYVPWNVVWVRPLSWKSSFYDFVVPWLVNVHTISSPVTMSFDVDEGWKHVFLMHPLTWKLFHKCHKHGRHQWYG